MSHYTVAVVHKEDEDIEAILAPFQENNMGDCPKEYLEFDIEVKKGEEKKYQDEELKRDYWKKPEQKEKLGKYLKMTPEEFVDEYGGYSKNENGDWGYLSNPNSKWDWYAVGGRWQGSLKLKDGAVEVVEGKKSWSDKTSKQQGWCDSAKIKDIDWEGMKKNNTKKYSDFWEEAHERLKNEAIKETELDWRYGIKKEDTKESYVERNSSFIFYSLLMDGEWKEAGAMGWFGSSSANEEDKKNWEKQSIEIMNMLKKERSEDVITMVDCHI